MSVMPAGHLQPPRDPCNSIPGQVRLPERDRRAFTLPRDKMALGRPTHGTLTFWIPISTDLGLPPPATLQDHCHTSSPATNACMLHFQLIFHSRALRNQRLCETAPLCCTSNQNFCDQTTNSFTSQASPVTPSSCVSIRSPLCAIP